MDKIERLTSVSQFNTRRGQSTLHPLVTVLDQSKSVPIRANQYLSELYVIFLKDFRCEDFQYGRNQYDYEGETLLFMAPGQVFGFDLPDDVLVQPSGWALVFHPDFIRGTSLSKRIHEYGFFSYDATEALHVSDRERQIVLECFQKIKEELERGIDKHSKILIVSNIELFLNYCVRFYDRQFLTREPINSDLLVRFEQLLNAYFTTDQIQKLGLPSVAYFADQLNLSAKYFGDLIRKETSKSALEYIQMKLLEVAKDRVLDTNKSVNEIAYELGFKYQQHFTRFFKQKVGLTPSDYRASIN